MADRLSREEVKRLRSCDHDFSVKAEMTCPKCVYALAESNLVLLDELEKVEKQLQIEKNRTAKLQAVNAGLGKENKQQGDMKEEKHGREIGRD